MSVLAKHVIVCLKSIKNTWERRTVEREIRASGKEVVEISLEEMQNFCGNVLQL